jgi:hypothetical protein
VAVSGSTSSTTSTSVPTVASSPVTGGSIIACPEMQSSTTSAG